MRSALSTEILELKQQGLLRTLRDIELTSLPNAVYINGAAAVAFCSNDYLGLSRHPLVVNAAREALGTYGTGSTASRYINGNYTLYKELEELIAGYKKTDRSVVFSSGYLANIGIITALATLKVNLHIDRLCHASIIDGCKLSGSKFYRFRHNDTDHLAENLAKRSNGQKNVIITESIFSMDGDTAPVSEIKELAKTFDAIVVVDCAHSTGVFPESGNAADIEIGTLSKALGSLGGFAACSNEFADFIIAKARSLMYTTALPPAAVASAIAAFKLLKSDNDIRKTLQSNVKLTRQLLEQSDFKIIGDAKSPIIPVIVGDSDKAVELSRKLLESGIFIPAIRPPTVEPGKARLRLTVNALHGESDIYQMVETLKKIWDGS